jgi:hypothetical protein
MNLIEQLGGYEKASKRVKSIDIRTSGYKNIKKALLKYRRENNIFEVGDKVVFEAHFFDGHEGLGYGEITYCTMDKRVFEIDNYYLISIDEIRHATPAEIKAGHRL